MKYIVIGAGISGLTSAQMLYERGNEVIVLERDSRPGGLIKCDIVQGNLFHRTGGHVFNSKRHDVKEWFWRFFNRDEEFISTVRNSIVQMDEKKIPYPVENHVYMFDPVVQKLIIHDWLNRLNNRHRSEQYNKNNNFRDFLIDRFGKTLYECYFKPYNEKIWRCDLASIPLSWLDGKLPMPSVEEMIYNNMNHLEEREFVHSSFYYPKFGGSQFLANKLAENITIIYNTNVEQIEKTSKGLQVNGISADRVIFCGNVKDLPKILALPAYEKEIDKLESHGTTSVFCEIDKNEFSWIYLPSKTHEAHRIICTGNFATSNNTDGKMTATIEFTDYISKDDIIDNLKRIPYHPKYLTHNYAKYSYPVQNSDTRDMIDSLKSDLSQIGIYLVGRFAEWEYFNMDVAIGSAMDTIRNL